MPQERDFKGVWIPKDIWLDETMTWMEKLLLTEIDSLVKNGECFASNEYFAKFFNLSKDRISRIISSLNKKGYIEVNLIYKEGTKQIEKRIITTIGYKLKEVERLKTLTEEPIVKNTDTPIGENTDTPIGENTDTPIGENTKDNNTIINNTSNNNNNICSNEHEYDILFEKFWKAYPKKKSKALAKRSLKTALKKHSFETIMKGLEAYKKHLSAKKTDYQYIAYPTTFLNGEKFNDEYDESELKGGKRVNDPNDFGAEALEQNFNNDNNWGF